MTRLVVIFGFIIAFAAGLILGVSMQLRQATAAEHGSTTRPSAKWRGFLGGELNLTSQQHKAMQQIWEQSFPGERNELEDKRREFRRQRDEAIATLLGPADMVKYDEIRKTYGDQSDQVDQEIRAAFERAVQQSDALLTSEQRTKYQELLARWRKRGSDHGPGDWHRGPAKDDTRWGDKHATPRPATEP